MFKGPHDSPRGPYGHEAPVTWLMWLYVKPALDPPRLTVLITSQVPTCFSLKEIWIAFLWFVWQSLHAHVFPHWWIHSINNCFSVDLRRPVVIILKPSLYRSLIIGTSYRMKALSLFQLFLCDIWTLDVINIIWGKISSTNSNNFPQLILSYIPALIREVGRKTAIYTSASFGYGWAGAVTQVL